VEISYLLAQSALTDVCGSDPGLLCWLIYKITGSEGLAEASAWIGRPLNAAIIMAIAWLLKTMAHRSIARTVERIISGHEQDADEAVAAAEERAESEDRPNLQRRAIARALAVRDSSERSTQRTRTLGNVMSSVASIVIYTIGIGVALGEFDVNLGPFIASAGIVGVALGFGAQSLVKDFLSGIFMLVEDQYGVGDTIDFGEASGVVEVVNLRTTRIRDVEGTLWHVPNGEIRRVANKSQEWARTVLDIQVAYGTNLAEAMQVIKQVADDVWQEAPENATILEEPEIWGVEAFGESSIDIRLAMKVEPAEQWATARLVRGRLKEAFDAASIEIPFPQRTVWIHQGDADPVPAAAGP
jgi:small conductance mechanosensitive channel